jgi:hypothetical protein
VPLGEVPRRSFPAASRVQSRPRLRRRIPEAGLATWMPPMAATHEAVRDDLARCPTSWTTSSPPGRLERDRSCGCCTPLLTGTTAPRGRGGRTPVKTGFFLSDDTGQLQVTLGGRRTTRHHRDPTRHRRPSCTRHPDRCRSRRPHRDLPHGASRVGGGWRPGRATDPVGNVCSRSRLTRRVAMRRHESTCHLCRQHEAARHQRRGVTPAAAVGGRREDLLATP